MVRLALPPDCPPIEPEMAARSMLREMGWQATLGMAAGFSFVLGVVMAIAGLWLVGG